MISELNYYNITMLSDEFGMFFFFFFLNLLALYCISSLDCIRVWLADDEMGKLVFMMSYMKSAAWGLFLLEY